MVTNATLVAFKSDKGFDSGPGTNTFDILQANEYKITSGIDITSQTISGTVINGDINIAPNGSGRLVTSIIRSTSIADQRIVISSSGTLSGDSKLTWNGSTLGITGTVNARSVVSTDPLNELTLSSPTAVSVTAGLSVTGNASANNVSATVKVSAPLMEASGTANKIRFYFNNVAAFPSATTWEGSLAYAADTNRIYYAKNGTWQLFSIPGDAVNTTQSSSFSDVTITGGSINGTPVGATTPSTGRFTSATVATTPTQPTQLTNKQYVDSRFYLALALAG